MPLSRLVESNETLISQGRKDIQGTTFSLDGLSRLLCNTWEEIQAARGNRGFDIVIVGSGMYGAYTAATLYNSGRALGDAAPRIVLLEAGPFLISEHVQNLTMFGNLQELVDQPLVGPASQQQLIEAPDYVGAGGFSNHARCVGGKSLFWGGWSPRLKKDDLRRADSPWPKEVVDHLFGSDGYDVVEEETGTSEETDFIRGKLYELLRQRAEAVYGQVTLDNGTQLEKPTFPPIAVQGEPPLSGLFSFDKFSSLPLLADAIRQDANQSGGNDNRRRLFLMPNANALRLLNDKGLVYGVQFALIDRVATSAPENRGAPEVARSIETLELNAGGCVILAGNTINSTRLALNSFPRRLVFGEELMGRNLMYHVRSNHVWQVKQSALGLAGLAMKDRGNTALHIPGVSRLLDNQGRRGLFHFQFYASANVPEGAKMGPEDPEQYLYRLLPNFEHIQEILDAQATDTIAIGIRTCGETFGDRDTPIPPEPPDLKISWMDVSKQGTADEIFTTAAGQELARVPRAFVKLVETEDDKAVRHDETAAAFKFIASLAGADIKETGQRLSFDEFKNSPQTKVRYVTPSEREQDGIGTTYHECGTLWMGDDPLKSVTDVHGRFHHVSNAYCVDQSLFPTAGSANPVLTGLALARKVAKDLSDRFQPGTIPQVEPQFQLLYDGTNFERDWAMADARNFFEVKELNQLPLISAGLESDQVQLGVAWYTKKRFVNFDLRLQWRIFSPKANGGIFLRAPQPQGDLFGQDGFYARSLEVQIDERGFDPGKNVYGQPLHRTGALYNRLSSNRWAARAVSPRDGRPGYWNDYRIMVEGPRITIWLNGQEVCSGDHKAPLADGVIGLQCHTEVVQYRAIRIREL